MIKRNSHVIDELELMAYLDGELARERAAAVAEHLEGCEECRAVAGDLRGISQELAVWQVGSSNREIKSELSRALDEHEGNQRKKPVGSARASFPSFRRPRILVWATAVVVLVIGGAMLSLFKPARPSADFSALWPHREMAAPAQAPQASATPLKAPAAEGRILRQENRSLDKLASIAPGIIAPDSQASAKDQSEYRPLSELPIPSGPMIVRTAELAVVSTEFDQSRSRVEEILKRYNGYLGDLTVNGSSTSARTLAATLRIPADRLDPAMAELKKLGKVEAESQKGEEVSQQYVDLQARLANARNSEQRLTELLRRAGKLSDVLDVEEHIENVRENIERMEAERKNLAKQVAFSTLNMKIMEDYKERVQVVPDSTSIRLRNAAVEGYEMMVTGLINLLLFLVSWSPSLLLWGAILFFPVRWLWRKTRSHFFE